MFLYPKSYTCLLEFRLFLMLAISSDTSIYILGVYFVWCEEVCLRMVFKEWLAPIKDMISSQENPQTIFLRKTDLRKTEFLHGIDDWMIFSKATTRPVGL